MIGIKREPSVNPDIPEVKLHRRDQSTHDWRWRRL